MGVQDRRRAFGAQLRQAREAKNFGLRHLAAELGISYGMLGRVERGEHGMAEDSVQRAEKLLDLSPGELGWLLGQAPPPDAPSAEAAIESDPTIPAAVKQPLLDLLAAIRASASDNHQENQ